jgi:hypothetical protein
VFSRSRVSIPRSNCPNSGFASTRHAIGGAESPAHRHACDSNSANASGAPAHCARMNSARVASASLPDSLKTIEEHQSREVVFRVRRHRAEQQVTIGHQRLR